MMKIGIYLQNFFEICRVVEKRSDLALAEGNTVEFVASESLVFGELEERHGGVGSGREDEDERTARVRVVERFRQVKGRWLHKLLT